MRVRILICATRQKPCRKKSLHCPGATNILQLLRRAQAFKSELSFIGSALFHWPGPVWSVFSPEVGERERLDRVRPGLAN